MKRPRFHFICWQWGAIVSYETKEARDAELVQLRQKFPDLSFKEWDGLVYVSN